jgi:hypothetical protein
MTSSCIRKNLEIFWTNCLIWLLKYRFLDHDIFILLVWRRRVVFKSQVFSKYQKRNVIFFKRQNTDDALAIKGNSTLFWILQGHRIQVFYIFFWVTFVCPHIFHRWTTQNANFLENLILIRVNFLMRKKIKLNCL